MHSFAEYSNDRGDRNFVIRMNWVHMSMATIGSSRILLLEIVEYRIDKITLEFSDVNRDRRGYFPRFHNFMYSPKMDFEDLRPATKVPHSNRLNAKYVKSIESFFFFRVCSIVWHSVRLRGRAKQKVKPR